MARMHARRKGKSGSKKPLATSPPSWMSYKPAEVEAIVVKLAKQGKSSSMIGLILRDKYGIADIKMITEKTVSKILANKGLSPELPEDLLNLIKKAARSRKHLEANKKDMVTKRGVQLTESKIRRLIKYYLKKGRLPEGWKYTQERAKILAG